MPVVKIDPAFPDGEALHRAAELIRAGRLVAFPTETVYGLGAHALDARAVQRIFDAKGRPATNPLIVHVATVDDARQLAAEWPDSAQKLATEFWPGPLTLVLKRSERVPDITTAGLDSVAIRIPAHPVARALLVSAGVPIAAPSANRSMELSPTTAEHVEKSLGDRVDMIIDGGATHVGIESTVVDLTSTPPRVLRPGTISLDELGRVIPSIVYRPADKPDILRSPGMMERHYSPRAKVRLFSDLDELRSMLATDASGARAAVLCFSCLPLNCDALVRIDADPVIAARVLYATLHTLDDQGFGIVFVEEPPAETAWAGVRDRIRRMTA